MMSALDFQRVSKSLANGLFYDNLILSLTCIQAYRKIREKDAQLMDKAYKFFQNADWLCSTKDREIYSGIALKLSTGQTPTQEELQLIHSFFVDASQLEMSLTDDIFSDMI